MKNEKREANTREKELLELPWFTYNNKKYKKIIKIKSKFIGIKNKISV